MDDYEWMVKAFSAASRKREFSAARKLRDLGAAGAEFVPGLFQFCRDAFHTAELSKRDYHYLRAGTGSIGAVINAVGFCTDDPLHEEFLEWMLDFTHSEDRQILGIGIWGLSEIGIPPERVQERLVELIRSSHRKDDHEEVLKCRALAFRVLARVDRKIASEFKSTEACSEFLQAVDCWLQDYAQKGLSDGEGAREIEEEARWLR